MGKSICGPGVHHVRLSLHGIPTWTKAVLWLNVFILLRFFCCKISSQLLQLFRRAMQRRFSVMLQQCFEDSWLSVHQHWGFFFFFWVNCPFKKTILIIRNKSRVPLHHTYGMQWYGTSKVWACLFNLILHFTLRWEINTDGCDVRVKGFWLARAEVTSLHTTRHLHHRSQNKLTRTSSSRHDTSRHGRLASRGTPSIINDKSRHVTDIQDNTNVAIYIHVAVTDTATLWILSVDERWGVMGALVRVVTNCWVSYRVMLLSRPSSSLSPQHRSRVSLRTSASRRAAEGGERVRILLAGS